MFKVINGGQLPTRATKYSACVDLYANADVIIAAGETKLIPLGVCIDYEQILDGIDSFYPYNEGMLPEYKMDYFCKTNYLQLMLRSSLSKELIIANGAGVVDLDFAQEIQLRVHNPIKMSHNKNIPDQYLLRPVRIEKGDRVAQITLLEHKSWLLGIESEEERTSGFGSTGK